MRQSFADSSLVGGQTLPLARMGWRVLKMLSQLHNVVVVFVAFRYDVSCTDGFAAVIVGACWFNDSRSRKKMIFGMEWLIALLMPLIM